MSSKGVKVIIQDVEHKSSRDNKGTLPPDADWLGGDITKVTSDLLSSPPYSSVDNPQQTNLISGQLQLTIHSLKASIRKSIHGLVKLGHWETIFSYIQDNTVEIKALLLIAAELLASNPSPPELEYWVEIFKQIQNNQLSIVYQLAALKPIAAKLKWWIEILKYIKDNQLTFLMKLAASDPNPDELECWVEIVKYIKDNQVSLWPPSRHPKRRIYHDR
ncbi:MAG: hypothetical protein MMC33_009532 [Icmadophila ericetorum]|nr:hypothetical protein [Icmadophila ericetorum]